MRTELPLPDTTQATLFAQAVLVNHGDKPVSGTLEWKFGDLTVSESVDLQAGEKRDVAFDPQTLRNPRLWWPKGYGEQNLYPVSFRFTADGSVSDAKEFLSGVRQYRLEDWEEGQRAPFSIYAAVDEYHCDILNISAGDGSRSIC